MDTEPKPKTEHSFLFRVIKNKFNLLYLLFLFLFVLPVFTGGTFYWDKFLNKLFSPRIVETAYVKGVPVHISNDAYLTKNDVRQWIKTQPDLLLQSTSNIYVCDFSKDNVCSQNVDTSYDGGHVEETNSIYLDSNSHDLNYEMTDEMFRLFIDKYEELTGKKPEVCAIHAGLECGLLSEKMPYLDIVSIGPDMQGIHTPEERLNISSTKRVYEYLLLTLKDFYKYCE